MNARRYFSGAALVAAVVLTMLGTVKGAGVLLGLATAIELIASAMTGKKTNA